MSGFNSTFPWFPFMPREWLEGTRNLTLEQRGAYIDMICLQMLHEGPIREDYGWLAHQLHCPKQRARKLVTTLIEEMKFRRTSDGLLSNERCEAELQRRQEISEQNRRNVQKRYTDVSNADLCEQSVTLQKSSEKVGTLLEESSNKVAKKFEVSEKKDNDINDNQLRPNEIRSPIRSDFVALHIHKRDIEDSPLVESQSGTLPLQQVESLRASDESAPPAKPDYTPSFEAWWREYPARNGRKVGKKAAFTEWKKLKADQQALALDGLRRLLRFHESKPRERDFVPDANRWLKGAQWEAEYPTDEADAVVVAWWQKPNLLARVSDDDWRRLINKHTHNLTEPRWNVANLGPAPGRMDCVVPDVVVADMALTSIYDERGLRR